MYLMYVDESGDSGTVSSPTRFFALSAIVIHESRWREFIQTLITFRRTMRDVYGLPVRVEIHASEYVNGRPIDLPRYMRLAILRNALDELAKLDYISITNVVVEKAGKPDSYNVFDAAWATLFQRFENTLVSGNFPGGFKGDHGIVITDATAGKSLSRIVRRMSVFNYVPNDLRFGTGSRNIPIKRIIEDPYGKDSSETLPIQMCDVSAYFLMQRFAPNGYVRKVRAADYFERLGPVLNRRASRFDELGIVKL